MKCLTGFESRIDVTLEFIERNNLAINIQVAKEIAILQRDNDFFNFQQEVAIDFLSLNECQGILDEEYFQKVKCGEIEFEYISDVAEAAQDFLDYMVFAWGKAMDERGLSASRSLMKLSAWMEILGRKDIAEILQDAGLYAPYGRPALRKACQLLGIECPDYL